MKSAIFALDVGGTTVRAAIVNRDGRILAGPTIVPSPQRSSLKTFLRIVTTLLEELVAAIPEPARIVAVGIGMPGPFDYETGVSYMRHKFAKLYGKNVKNPLERALGVPAFFLNDAHAFALGAWRGEHRYSKRLIGITIGTGLGSGFIRNGKIITGSLGVSATGEIWSFPWRDKILEDWVSKRAIERLYREYGGKKKLSVKEIATKTRQNDRAGKEAFLTMGKELGAGLAAVAVNFRPDVVVVGGQISKAFDLFGLTAQKTFVQAAGRRVPFLQVQNEYAALVGAAHHSLQRLKNVSLISEDRY